MQGGGAGSNDEYDAGGGSAGEGADDCRSGRYNLVGAPNDWGRRQLPCSQQHAQPQPLPAAIDEVQQQQQQLGKLLAYLQELGYQGSLEGWTCRCLSTARSSRWHYYPAEGQPQGFNTRPDVATWLGLRPRTQPAVRLSHTKQRPPPLLQQQQQRAALAPPPLRQQERARLQPPPAPAPAPAAVAGRSVLPALVPVAVAGHSTLPAGVGSYTVSSSTGSAAQAFLLALSQLPACAPSSLHSGDVLPPRVVWLLAPQHPVLVQLPASVSPGWPTATTAPQPQSDSAAGGAPMPAAGTVMPAAGTLIPAAGAAFMPQAPTPSWRPPTFVGIGREQVEGAAAPTVAHGMLMPNLQPCSPAANSTVCSAATQQQRPLLSKQQQEAVPAAAPMHVPGTSATSGTSGGARTLVLEDRGCSAASATVSTVQLGGDADAWQLSDTGCTTLGGSSSKLQLEVPQSSAQSGATGTLQLEDSGCSFHNNANTVQFQSLSDGSMLQLEEAGCQEEEQQQATRQGGPCAAASRAYSAAPTQLLAEEACCQQPQGQEACSQQQQVPLAQGMCHQQMPPPSPHQQHPGLATHQPAPASPGDVTIRATNRVPEAAGQPWVPSGKLPAPLQHSPAGGQGCGASLKRPAALQPPPQPGSKRHKAAVKVRCPLQEGHPSAALAALAAPATQQEPAVSLLQVGAPGLQCAHGWIGPRGHVAAATACVCRALAHSTGLNPKPGRLLAIRAEPPTNSQSQPNCHAQHEHTSMMHSISTPACLWCAVSLTACARPLPPASCNSCSRRAGRRSRCSCSSKW